jgi:hypothetical protein
MADLEAEMLAFEAEMAQLGEPEDDQEAQQPPPPPPAPIAAHPEIPAGVPPPPPRPPVSVSTR